MVVSCLTFLGTAKFFSSDCTILHSHQQCYESLLLYPHQLLLMSALLIVDILVSTKLHQIVVFNFCCPDDVQHISFAY